jgi:hypothetical protein
MALRRWIRTGCLIGLIVLTACHGPFGGVRRAEVLDTPFPATLTNFHIARSYTCDKDGCTIRRERHCDENGCEIAFNARVTNPTDRDANVARCIAVIALDGGTPRHARFWMPGGAVAGFWVPAASTRHIEGTSALPLSYSEIRRLPESVAAACTGWDWHGDPPI